MLAVPTATPVTTPVVKPTLAMVVLLLLQVPPGVALESPPVPPTQTELAPIIADGSGFTVTIAVLVHPVASA